jgi:ribulose-bisphosphate carboxylase large chain
VIDSALAVTEPLFQGDGRSYAAMPVFSSGQTAAHAAATYKAVGTSDLIFCAGGGIMGHPGGVSDGVASLKQAWEAALAGISSGEYAKGHPQLAVALETFGARIA